MQPDQQKTETQPAVPKSSDAQSQEELQRLYIEQQQRMSCPGCGETSQVF